MSRFVIFSFIVLNFNIGFAGTEGLSGGGGTHTCLNPDGTVKSSELYDLYEAREARGFKLIDAANLTANELLNIALKKINEVDPFFARDTLSMLQYYSTNKLVVADKQFTIINDANFVFIDRGCQYRQIAQWRNEYKRIFIDGNTYSVFAQSQLNIAALALHEAIYAVLRQGYNHTNSDLARKLVGEAFSDQPLSWEHKPTVTPSLTSTLHVVKLSAVDVAYSGNVSAEYSFNPNVHNSLFSKSISKDSAKEFDIILLDKMHILYGYSARSNSGKLKFELFENGKLIYFKVIGKQYVNDELFISTIKYEIDIEPVILALKL